MNATDELTAILIIFSCMLAAVIVYLMICPKCF
jgi:hypothetical protein